VHRPKFWAIGKRVPPSLCHARPPPPRQFRPPCTHARLSHPLLHLHQLQSRRRPTTYRSSGCLNSSFIHTHHSHYFVCLCNITSSSHSIDHAHRATYPSPLTLIATSPTAIVSTARAVAMTSVLVAIQFFPTFDSIYSRSDDYCATSTHAYSSINQSRYQRRHGAPSASCMSASVNGVTHTWRRIRFCTPSTKSSRLMNSS
jgi:hypothetical protein